MVFDPTGKDDFIMDNAEHIYMNIHAGNGELTLVAPSNKAHTYRFEKPKSSNDFPPGTIFAYVLHEGHKFYLGQVLDSSLKLTRNSAFLEDTESVKGANYLIKMSMSQDLVNRSPMRVYNSGKCAVCGRRLERPKVSHKGIGPKCERRYYNDMLITKAWDGNS